jgi:hypothetical protein
MLGTLRMDIDTCITKYIEIAGEIFSIENNISQRKLGAFVNAIRGTSRFDPGPLEKAVKRLATEQLGDKATAGEDTPFRFESSRGNKSPRCKV